MEIIKKVRILLVAEISICRFQKVNLIFYIVVFNIQLNIIPKYSPAVINILITHIYTKLQLFELVRDIRLFDLDIFDIAGGPFVYQSYLIFKRSLDENYVYDELKKMISFTLIAINLKSIYIL